MDSKNNNKNILNSFEIKGFEEFAKDLEMNFKDSSKKNIKETSFEALTFLKDDETRLGKVKNLLVHKIPFAMKYDQFNTIVKLQQDELNQIKNEIFQFSEDENSGFKKSLSEIFDQYFKEI